VVKLASISLLCILVAAAPGCDAKKKASEAEGKADAKADDKADAKANAKAPDAKADAKADAKVDAKADAKAEPAAVAQADYAKAIVGTWKQVGQRIEVPGGEPLDMPTPDNLEMFLEFKADGGYVNRGIVDGTEHKTESTYKVEGATFTVGTNAAIDIKSMTSSTMETGVKTEAGNSTTRYERVEN